MEKPKNNPQPPKNPLQERLTNIKPDTPRQPKTEPKPNPTPKK